jgi:hypothetical protein
MSEISTANQGFATVAGGPQFKIGSDVKLCLAENDRRMSRYDMRLLRPTLVPFLVKLAIKFLPG